MLFPWLEVASLMPLPTMANDVGDDIIEIDAFPDAAPSHVTTVIVILDRSHRFMPIIFFYIESES
jgi:hypothetical protein